ncbi:MAG: protease inhibitor Inh/omp19 family protein [Pseudomonadota bacterium]
MNLRSSASICVLLAVAVAASACTRTLPWQRSANRPAAAPAPLTAAPVDNVTSDPLQPAQPQTDPNIDPTDPNNPTTTDPNATQPTTTTVAAAEPEGGGKPVSRDALIGAWTVSAGGGACQIFLALTKWQGGYRAASRGCSAADISDVQAWDVKGKQVVLVDSNGNTAARLYKSNDSRYDGSTSGGGAISFSR